MGSRESERATRRHVIIATGVHSDNLGDAVIGQCLKAALLSKYPDLAIDELDVAGRVGSGRRNLSRKFKLLTFMSHLPPTARAGIVVLGWAALVRQQCLNAWRPMFRGSGGLLVIGGGHLLVDTALNCPLKIHALTMLAVAHGYDIVFNACGVSAHWSPLGRRLFRSALCNASVRGISVRDERSRQYLLTHLGTEPRLDPTIVPDPGLCVSTAYPEPQGQSTTRRFVGLGVAHPVVLRSDTEGRGGFDVEHALGFWTGAIRELQSRGEDVALFTNGSEEDCRFLATLCDHLRRELSTMPEVFARPTMVAHLVAQIRTMSVVVAYRLHASVVAYSLGIPSVGLVWDEKVRAFYQLTGRPTYCIEPAMLTPAGAVESLIRCRADEPDPAWREQLKSRVLDSFAGVLG